MITRVAIPALAAVVVAVLTGALVALPQTTRAVGFDADAECVPVIPVCGCGMVMGSKGCKGGNNKYLCPCTDTTSGISTKGICTANFECTGQSFGGGAGQKGGMIDKALQALKSLLQKKGGGGGGGPPPIFASSTAVTRLSAQGTSLNEIPEVPSEPTFNKPPTPDEVPDLSDSQGSGFSILRGVFNTGGGGAEEKTTVENVGVDTVRTDALGRASEEVLSESGRAADNIDDRGSTDKTIGREPQISSTVIEPIQVKDTSRVSESDEGATFTTEFVDEETSTGVAGFFGLSGASQRTAQEQQESVVGRLCTTQPWKTSFVARLFSSSFFDSLCEKRGFTPGGQIIAEKATSGETPSTVAQGGPQLSCTSGIARGGSATLEWSCGAAVRSAGVNFTTNGWPTGSTGVTPAETTTYTLECARGGTASCTVEVASPEVEIVAHPQQVPLGARTQIFWSSSNVASCVISGPGLEEEALEGSATTGAILNQSTFSITCETEDGVVVNGETVVEVGI